MDTNQFHIAIEDAFKKALQTWDCQTNPLEWDNFPSAVAGLMEKVIQEALEESRDGIFGAPFHIDTGGLSDDYKTHIPNDDTIITVSMNFFNDGDYTEYCVDEVKFNLADVVMVEAEIEGSGWMVRNAIDQLERTIARLKAEAAARGWELAD